MQQRESWKSYSWIGVLSIGLVVLIVLALFSFAVVPYGNIAVMQEFGAITGNTKAQGFNIKSIIAKPIFVNIQTQKYEVDAEAASKDLQDVKTRVAINYKVSPDRAAEILRTLGTHYIENIAHPAVQEAVKEVTTRYNAEDMILKRSDVKADITKSLSERLAERGIVTEIVNITNFQFSAQFTQAIESKVIAVQKVLEAENKLRQVEVEARMAEQKAKGEAAAVIVNAEGQAKSIAIVTAAQVQANKDINASLNDNILRYIMLDRLGKDIRVIVIPSGQGLTLGDISK